MPPVPLWCRGSRDYGLFKRRVFEMRGPGWAMRQLTANGQPALAAYAPEPGGGHRLIPAPAALSGCPCPVWLTHRRAARRQSDVTFRYPQAGGSCGPRSAP